MLLRGLSDIAHAGFYAAAGATYAAYLQASLKGASLTTVKLVFKFDRIGWKFFLTKSTFGI